MVTRVLMFETADGVVEHLTAQVPPDADGGMMLPELLSWGGRIWKRCADSVFRLASVWVPDREEFASSIFDEEDIEAMRIQEAKRAIATARLSATEIATKVAEEVATAGERFDFGPHRDAMKQGWWVACIKIITEINGDAPKFSDQQVDRIAIEQHIDWARIACFAFEAYNSVGEKAWMTFDGRPVPRWPALNDEVREKWTAAVKACVLDEQRRKMEAVNECATAIRHAARDQETIRRKLEEIIVLRQQLSIAETSAHNLADRCATIADALRDLLVLMGANPLSDLAQGTNLAGCVERAKKALEGWS
jgi:hypothetical protein